MRTLLLLGILCLFCNGIYAQRTNTNGEVISSKLVGDTVYFKILRCSDEYIHKEYIEVLEVITDSCLYDFEIATKPRKESRIEIRPVYFKRTRIILGSQIFEFIIDPPYEEMQGRAHSWSENGKEKLLNESFRRQAGGSISRISNEGEGYVDTIYGTFSLKEAKIVCMQIYEGIIDKQISIRGR